MRYPDADFCLACGALEGEGPPWAPWRYFRIDQTGPFCSDPCALRWSLWPTGKRAASLYGSEMAGKIMAISPGPLPRSTTPFVFETMDGTLEDGHAVDYPALDSISRANPVETRLLMMEDVLCRPLQPFS